MSNYPPAPPGGPGSTFNSSTPFTQSVSANLPGLPPYAYRPAETHSLSLAGLPHPQYANAYFYNSNRLATQNPPDRSLNPGASVASLDQASKTALPQPQGSIISRPPYNGFPQAPHIDQQPATATSNVQRSDIQQGQVPQLSQADPKEPSFTPKTALKASATGTSDLEDGELSDDSNGEEPNVQSAIRNSFKVISRASPGLDSYGTQVASGSQRVPDSMLDQRSRTMTDKHKSNTVGNDLYTNNESPRSADVAENSKALDEDKRRQAKDALRLCYERGLGFVHFVREGVNPALLEVLYSEMGVKISSRDLAVGRGSNGEHIQKFHDDGAKAHTVRTSPSAVGTNKSPDPKSKGETASAQLAKLDMKDGSPQRTVPANQPKASNSMPNRDQSNRSGVQEIPTLPTQNNTSINRSPHTSAKAGDKSYDRKDHIARMLAARAGKPASIANPPTPVSQASLSKPSMPHDLKTNSSPSTSLAQEKQRNIDESQPKPSADAFVRNPEGPPETATTASAIATEKEDQLSQSNQNMPLPPPVSDLEAKKRAQTELARRKMEALLNRNTSKVQEASIPQPISLAAFKPTVATTAGPANTLYNPSPIIAIPTASQAPPTPQSSFFSPTPGRQFSLPGLFMPPTPLGTQPDGNSQNTGTQPSQQHSIEAAKGIVTTPPPAIIPESNEAPKAQPSEVAQLSPPTTEIVNKARKRQKAADFIDPPATRVKRLFGSSGDKSVVIEVSEDETLDGSLDDVEMDVDINQDIYSSKQVGIKESRNSQQINAPDTQLQRNSATTHPQTSAGTRTPLVTHQTYGKDSDGLRSKEMEIEFMKRRIAEVEQRRKAKRSSSRAQTPTTSKVSSTAQQSRASSEIIEPSKTDPAPVDVPGATTANHVEKKEDVVHHAAPKTETKNQERLLAEQLGIDTEQQLDELDQRESERQEDPKQQSEIEDRENQDRQQPIVEPNGRLELVEECLSHLDEQTNVQIEEVDNARLDSLRSKAVTMTETEQAQQAMKNVIKERKEERRAAIEAGLPLLDAEVQKTEQKLQHLRNQIRELESDLQRGVEGRRNLVEELRSLSLDQETALGSLDVGSASVEIRSSDGNERSSSHSTPILIDSTLSAPNADQSIPSVAEVTLPATTTVRQPSTSSSLSGLRSNGDLEEDVMDMSKSDLDDGEISEHTPQPTSRPQSNLDLVEMQEAYEPPAVIDIKQTPLSSVSDVQEQGSEANATGHFSLPPPHGGPADHSNDGISELSPRPSSQAGNPDTRLNRTASDSDIDESDDYEPPEPVSPSELAALDNETVPQNSQLIHSTAVSTTNQRPLVITEVEVQAPAGAASAHPDPLSETNHAKPKQNLNHFAPYESPLKQFKSYRYHRSFPADVAHGFRSLTYSHDIKPEEPICPFEIGGTCNDQSCPYQHFRDMSLSDNMILLQLGSEPEGLSAEEKTAYNEGLKNLIRDIRSRHVRDFNSMAADITTYRANFIGDNTKVLPL